MKWYTDCLFVQRNSCEITDSIEGVWRFVLIINNVIILGLLKLLVILWFLVFTKLEVRSALSWHDYIGESLTAMQNGWCVNNGFEMREVKQSYMGYK